MNKQTIESFGQFPAAKNLWEILNKPENLKFRRRLSCFQHKYNRELNFLSEAVINSKDKDCYKRILILVRNRYLNDLEGFKEKLPPIVFTHLRSVIVTYYKIHLRFGKDNEAYKTRKLQILSK